MAVTGDGDFPFRSSWLGRGRGRGRGRGANPRKIVNVAVSDAHRLVWTDWFFEAAAAGAISGAVSVTFATSGALTGAGALAGSSSLAFTTAGILRGTGALSGSASAAFTTSATGLAVGALSGSSNLTFTVQALSFAVAGISGSASLAFGASGNLTAEAGGTQNLHGRRIRGKRVIYPDELDPLPEVRKIEPPEPLPSLETAEAALTEAKVLLEQAIAAKAEKKRAKAIDALETALGEAQARYDAAKERENAIIQRLRDEDEFWLLAA